jgi:hypothetical protein
MDGKQCITDSKRIAELLPGGPSQKQNPLARWLLPYCTMESDGFQRRMRSERAACDGLTSPSLGSRKSAFTVQFAHGCTIEEQQHRLRWGRRGENVLHRKATHRQLSLSGRQMNSLQKREERREAQREKATARMGKKKTVQTQKGKKKELRGQSQIRWVSLLRRELLVVCPIQQPLQLATH